MTEIISIFMFYLLAAFIAIQILDILLAFKSDKSFPPIAMVCNFLPPFFDQTDWFNLSKNPEEQPCQPEENPILPNSFNQICILFQKSSFKFPSFCNGMFS